MYAVYDIKKSRMHELKSIEDQTATPKSTLSTCLRHVQFNLIVPRPDIAQFVVCDEQSQKLKPALSPRR